MQVDLEWHRFEAIECWISGNAEERKASFGQLFGKLSVLTSVSRGDAAASLCVAGGSIQACRILRAAADCLASLQAL